MRDNYLLVFRCLAEFRAYGKTIEQLEEQMHHERRIAVIFSEDVDETPTLHADGRVAGIYIGNFAEKDRPAVIANVVDYLSQPLR